MPVAGRSSHELCTNELLTAVRSRTCMSPCPLTFLYRFRKKRNTHDRVPQCAGADAVRLCTFADGVVAARRADIPAHDRLADGDRRETPRFSGALVLHGCRAVPRIGGSAVFAPLVRPHQNKITKQNSTFQRFRVRDVGTLCPPSLSQRAGAFTVRCCSLHACRSKLDHYPLH